MKNLERGKILTFFAGEIMPSYIQKISFFQYFYAFLYDHSQQFLSRYFAEITQNFSYYFWIIFPIKILERGKNLTLCTSEIMPLHDQKISFFQYFYAFQGNRSQ